MKKVVCALLSILLITVLIMLLCSSASSLAYVRGDADGDGTVTAVDTTLMRRVIAGIQPDADGSIALRGDVDGDGLSLPDVTAVQYHLARMNEDYHVGETVISTQPVAFPTEDNQLPIM